MAKQTILTEIGTGEVMYPQTLASLVQTADGGNVDEGLEKAKFKVFVDMFNNRCKVGSSRYEFGGYFPDRAPDRARPFLLNKIWLSYEEALAVMQVPDNRLGNSVNGFTAYRPGRTYFPLVGETSVSINGLCSFNSALEVVRIVDYYIANNGVDPDTARIRISNTMGVFGSCANLTEVQGILHMPTTDSQGVHFYNSFGVCRKLHTLWLHGVCLDITTFRWLQSIRCECLQYLIENAANTKAITITVHPDVYAKLTGDTTNTAAAALTEEEAAAWQQVLADAVEKNISFATI